MSSVPISLAAALPATALPVRRRLEQRGVVLGAAGLLFLATIVARELAPGNRDELLGLMFVIPIALVGLELGVWSGIAAGVATLAFVAVRGAHSEPSLDVVGVAMRGVVYIGVGALAGRFSDRMRAFQSHQARLLATEHERMVLAGELYCLQLRLEEQCRNAGRILDQHEQERRGIADQLHEQAAQAMAASLLAVNRLERGGGDELTEAQLQKARHSVSECIAELRRLAGSLRSPVLEELGLGPALERLCEADRQEHSRSVELSMRDVPQRLAAEAELSAYRAVEETLAAMRGAREVCVCTKTEAGALKIEIAARGAAEGARGRVDPEQVDALLLTARARLEMVGGSLLSSHSADGVVVAVEIPLAAPLGVGDREAVAKITG